MLRVLPFGHEDNNLSISSLSNVRLVTYSLLPGSLDDPGRREKVPHEPNDTPALVIKAFFYRVG